MQYIIQMVLCIQLGLLLLVG